MPDFAEWNGFYVIVGSAAGALIGLQFVVLTLISNRPVLPFAAHAMVSGSAYMAQLSLRAAMFALGAATLILLFVGIHNAWDAVTYHVFVNKREKGEAEESDLQPAGKRR